MEAKKKGKAVRVYSINKERLREALDAVEETIKPLRELLEQQDDKPKL